MFFISVCFRNSFTYGCRVLKKIKKNDDPDYEDNMDNGEERSPGPIDYNTKSNAPSGSSAMAGRRGRRGRDEEEIRWWKKEEGRGEKEGGWRRQEEEERPEAFSRTSLDWFCHCCAMFSIY